MLIRGPITAPEQCQELLVLAFTGSTPRAETGANIPRIGGAGQRRTLLGRYKEGYGSNFKEPVTLVSWRTGGALGYTILCAHPVSSGVGSRGRRGLFGLRVEVCFWRIPGGFASEF